MTALPAADELRRIPVLRPESLLTVDPGLATVPPEQLQQMTLDQAEGTAPGPATVIAEAAEPRPEIPDAGPADRYSAEVSEPPAN